MNFLLFAPSSRYSFREAIDFAELALDLSQVARLVISLMTSMFLVKMRMAIDLSGESFPVIFNSSLFFEGDNSNQLLV